MKATTSKLALLLTLTALLLTPTLSSIAPKKPKKIKNNSKYRFGRRLKKKMITHECVLGARVYPFKYIGATQTMELKMELKSNCMDFSTLNFFVLPFNTKMKLTKVVHPKKVILSIYNRVYQFIFSAPKKKGRGKLFFMQYNKVRIIPSKWTKPAPISRDNNVLLRTTQMDPFTKVEMNRLLIAKNPVLCKLSKDKRTMYCQI